MRIARALLVLVLLFVATPAHADHLLPNHFYLQRALASPPLTFRRTTGFPQAEAIAYWNDLLVTPVFALVDGAADIILATSGPCPVGCAIPPVNGQPCQVVLVRADARTDTRFLAHELGHCIGFADHMYADQAQAQETNGPKVCDQVDSPLYSAYAGTMSHCALGTNSTKIEDDRTMLRAVGFTVAVACFIPPALATAPAFVQILARILRRVLCGIT